MVIQEGGEFAGYRIVRKLGAGGMGQVWLVENPNLHRLEAMKVVPTATADQDFASRFTTEARTAAGLDHPNIVTVYAYGIEGDAAWFTMSYLEGEDLTRVGALALFEVAAIVGCVADAIDYANSRGVIHRDIKPANIIVRRDADGQIERVTVLDFGIAKLMDGTRLTATSAFVGTLAYTSPESLTGAAVVPRSDQYSLAATTYQLLTGWPPFTGDSLGALMMAHISGPVPHVGDMNSTLRPLDSVIARGLAKTPDERYATSNQFAEALAAKSVPSTGSLIAGHAAPSLLSDAPRASSVRPHTPQARATLRPSVPQAKRPQHDSAAKRNTAAAGVWRRHWGGFIAAAIGVVAIIGLSYTMLAQNSFQTAPPDDSTIPHGFIKVTYKVTAEGTFYGPAKITFSTRGQTDSGTQINETQDVSRLPWVKDVLLVDSPNQLVTLSVWQPAHDRVKCELFRNGKLVMQSEVGSYANCQTTVQ